MSKIQTLSKNLPVHCPRYKYRRKNLGHLLNMGLYCISSCDSDTLGFYFGHYVSSVVRSLNSLVCCILQYSIAKVMGFAAFPLSNNFNGEGATRSLWVALYLSIHSCVYALRWYTEPGFPVPARSGSGSEEPVPTVRFRFGSEKGRFWIFPVYINRTGTKHFFYTESCIWWRKILQWHWQIICLASTVNWCDVLTISIFHTMEVASGSFLWK